MTMLNANSPTFRQQHPNGAIVRDRLGRLVRGVAACDPETGEAISFVSDKIVEDRWQGHGADMMVYSYCEDGEFWTGPDFGCVHHQQVDA